MAGTGRSLTGDTRFSVRTGGDGRFEAVLPASGQCEYSLFAHDGQYQEWRTWANGVGPTIQTKPGQVVADVEIRLTRPADVRGKVTDGEGRPIANREVRARATDELGNENYTPTVMTKNDGSYDLKFIRPGEQSIQVAPFVPDSQQPPAETIQILDLAPGQSKPGVDFRLAGAASGHERRLRARVAIDRAIEGIPRAFENELRSLGGRDSSRRRAALRSLRVGAFVTAAQRGSAGTSASCREAYCALR